MAYNVIATITSFKDDDAMLIEELGRFFTYSRIQRFDVPFKGIICLINLSDYTNEEEKKYNCGDDYYETIQDYLNYYMVDKLPLFSKIFPDKTFGLVQVDCFGGLCYYEGYTVKNGNKVKIVHKSMESHIDIIQTFIPDYSDHYFEPFTKDFFSRKGVITGTVLNFTITAIGLALKNDWTAYNVEVGKDFAIIKNQQEFYICFTGKEASRKIIIEGKIYNDDEIVKRKIIDIIHTSLIGVDYEIDILCASWGGNIQLKSR